MRLRARVRHRHHPRRRLASSASSRSRRGARCSATPSTPASSCSSPRSSTTSTATSRSTSRARSSPSCSPTASASSARSPTGYWEDVGTLDAYVRAHKDVLDGRGRARHPGLRDRRRRVARGGRRGPPRRAVVGPAVIGDDCRVEAGTRLGEYTVLGANVRVRGDADLERVVIHDNAYLGEACRLRGTVVGRVVRPPRACARSKRASCSATSASSARTRCSPRASRCTRSRPSRPAPSSTPRSCGSRAAPAALFGRNGVAGLANVDITPELATKVAMAYGTTLKKGATVVTSRDSSRSARMLKRAMMAGLNAAGVNVDGPRGRLACRSPGSSCAAPPDRRPLGAPRARTTRSR